MTRHWMWSGLALVALVGARAGALEPGIAPVTRDGTVSQVMVNPHGDPDGLVLRDGTVVRFPPHAVADPAQLRAGMTVHVTGDAETTASGTTLFDATVTSAGRTIADSTVAPTPPRRPPPLAGPDRDLVPMTAHGRVRSLLANPDGIIDRFVLDDGTMVEAGPGARLARLGLTPGAQVSVTGVGGSYPQGRSLRAQSLQVGNGPTVTVDRRPPPPPAP